MKERFATAFLAIALSIATTETAIGAESRAEDRPLAAAPNAPAPAPAALAAVPAPPSVSTPAVAADAAPDAAPAYTMRTYIVGFLRRGPKWTPERTPETAKLQEGHMANINRMAETGKLILAGPFSDGGDLRGMFVFDLTDIEEAKAMAEQDPAVQAGRLVIDWHSWYSASGIRSDATAPASPPAATPVPPPPVATPAPTQ